MRSVKKPPYVCNLYDCRKTCHKNQYVYDAVLADAEYQNLLSSARSRLRLSDADIAQINEILTPLMVHKHHSVNHVYIAHGDRLPLSKSSLYRYVDRGVLNVRNLDLARKVRFRAKRKHSNNERNNIETDKKLGRFYHDFQSYYEMNPQASIVEMDTVIGTKGGNGGKCFLTLLFRQFNFMLIYLLPGKKANHITEIFDQLKVKLSEKEFACLFEIILTDNGTEFSDPDSIESSLETGEKLVNIFYCDPHASWQKGSLEKNHEYIRYVLPKGASFAGLTQDDCYLLASHINSVPRTTSLPTKPLRASLDATTSKHFKAISSSTMILICHPNCFVNNL